MLIGNAKVWKIGIPITYQNDEFSTKMNSQQNGKLQKMSLKDTCGF